MPAVVSRVKYASKVITIEADIPEAIGSNFFCIFICVFSFIGLYTVMKLKKPLIFLKSLPNKLNRFYTQKSKEKMIVDNKSKNKKLFNPVTNFDKSFEKFIRLLIEKNFPKDGIVGEEFKKKISSNDFSWTIDPIDGTKAFVIGVPTWSNLIGLTFKEKSLIGLVNFPELNAFYLNDMRKSYLYKNGKKKIIRSSNVSNLNNIKIVGNFYGKSSQKQIKNLIGKFGNSFRHVTYDALNYCLLAEGKVDAVIETNLKPYDIVPLIQIIKKSGGYVSNWKNESPEKGGDILATSNRVLHDKMLRNIKTFVEIK